MKVILDAALAARRRGRFLGSLLNAAPAMDGLPEGGLMLMDGRDFQGRNMDPGAALADWTKRPGRTLLLLPPFDPGPVSPEELITTKPG